MDTLTEEHERNRCMFIACPLRLLLCVGDECCGQIFSFILSHVKLDEYLKKSDMNEARMMKGTFSLHNLMKSTWEKRKSRERKSLSFHV